MGGVATGVATVETCQDALQILPLTHISTAPLVEAYVTHYRLGFSHIDYEVVLYVESREQVPVRSQLFCTPLAYLRDLILLDYAGHVLHPLPLLLIRPCSSFHVWKFIVYIGHPAGRVLSFSSTVSLHESRLVYEFYDVCFLGAIIVINRFMF